MTGKFTHQVFISSPPPKPHKCELPSYNYMITMQYNNGTRWQCCERMSPTELCNKEWIWKGGRWWVYEENV